MLINSYLYFSLRKLVIMSRLTPAYTSQNCRKLSYMSRSSAFTTGTTLPVTGQNRTAKNGRATVIAYPPPAVVRYYSQLPSTNLRSGFLSPRISIVNPRRKFVGWVPAVLRSVLKIRYLLLGGAIGGGASLAKVKFNEIQWGSEYRTWVGGWMDGWM